MGPESKASCSLRIYQSNRVFRDLSPFGVQNTVTVTIRLTDGMSSLIKLRTKTKHHRCGDLLGLIRTQQELNYFEGKSQTRSCDNRFK